MTPEQKKAILIFCNDIVRHDPWMYREVCDEILKQANFDGPANLVTNDSGYFVSFFLVSGQSVALSRSDGGWSFDWGRPPKRSCENMLHYAEGGDIICPDCGKVV